MFAGQMGCEALNFLLKRWIREERPRRKSESLVKESHGLITLAEMNGKGYGMPSSHSQFVTFFSLSLSLFLLLRHVPNPTTTHTPISLPERALLSLVACICAAAVALSRVYLNYHTSRQVLVGCGAGAGFAIVWFGFTSYIRRTGWIDWALDTQWARALRTRDLVTTEDLVDAGWQRWHSRRMARHAEQNGVPKKSPKHEN